MSIVSCHRSRIVAVLAAAAMLAAGLDRGVAVAAKKASASVKKKAPAVPETPVEDISRICIEARSGLVIFEENADASRAPASMVKMMLMLLVSEGLRDGSWTLRTPVTVTQKSEGMGGTQLYLKVGEVWSLEQLMQAVAVASANDAAMAVAEGLWGSEEVYKQRMNARAAELGMASTVFRSVHGLPPDEGQDPDVTTARDMARLAQFCVMDPMILQWTSQKEATFRDGAQKESSTNHLLGDMEGCDGLKTGYTRAAGYCLTATVERDGIRLIGVVMHCNNLKERFDKTRQLIDESFSRICRKQVLARGGRVAATARVANSETGETPLQAAEDLWVVVKREDADKVTVISDVPSFVFAPLPAGAPFGQASACLGEKALGTVPLVLPAKLEEAGLRWRLLQSIRDL